MKILKIDKDTVRVELTKEEVGIIAWIFDNGSQIFTNELSNHLADRLEGEFKELNK